MSIRATTVIRSNNCGNLRVIPIPFGRLSFRLYLHHRSPSQNAIATILLCLPIALQP
ncbi:MAG: hypothetical protein LH679_13160 [Cyanobacteria bacterium CAN_BIN43]|nr:hypothetical protein [Cyanobacteria bacterium CAN_BIN43]